MKWNEMKWNKIKWNKMKWNKIITSLKRRGSSVKKDNKDNTDHSVGVGSNMKQGHNAL